jgi:hypothetical protein
MNRIFKKRRMLLFAISILSVVSVSAFFLGKNFYKKEEHENLEKKAVIIDGLVHFVNQDFIEEATEILTEADFIVETIGSEEVTVDMYRELPNFGYELIILRVHCGPLFAELSDGTEIAEGTVFFTTEVYDPKKHVTLQNRNMVAIGSITGEPDVVYFTIPPRFFDAILEGKFRNTTLILDSCYGFYKFAPDFMAKALENRGVNLFIGWNGEVQPQHSDSAVLSLLRLLYFEGLTVDESIDRIMKENGPDPYYGSKLMIYPREKGNLTLNETT